VSAAGADRPLALVADDDEGTRLMLSEAAELAGLSVVTVNDGRSALNIGLRTSFAVALLDVEMPGLNGLEVCRALRAATHARTLPIIMITARDDADSIRRAFEVGATDFIPKPLNLPLIPRRLEYILRNAAVLRSLEQREAEYRTLIQSIPDTVYLVDVDGHVRRIWNDPLAPTADAGAAGPYPLLHSLLPPVIGARAARSAALTARDGQTRSDEYTAVDQGGDEHSYELRYFRCGGGETMALRQDVTTRKRSEHRIHELAFNDALTGLPNRQSFFQRLAGGLAELAESVTEQERIAVAVFHLTGFGRINETFGHEVGDDVLRVVSRQLGRCLASLCPQPSGKLLARLDGNQFVLFARGPDPGRLAQQVAEALIAQLKSALRCGQHEFFLHVSIGIAVSPDHGSDATTLVKNASTAMFDCRSRAFSSYAIYADVMGARALMGISLDADLRRALVHDELQLYFQPKFDTASGKPLGAEALLRWTHPRLGTVSPGRFIPLAEQTGLILDLSAWVIRSACRQISEWRRQELDIPIAVNLSGKDFLHGDPAALIAREVAAAGIPATSLELEVTESVLVGDFERVSAGLAALRSLGCPVALDDFGTGYSSLRYLQRLPLDRLKVDQSFVTNVHRCPGDGAIFEMIMALARRVGLVVTAEGVDEQGQLDWLRARGCDEVQGFLLARPMPAADLELLLAGIGSGHAGLDTASG
jgi:diguanylate cyclase (GGDEF)-like protein